MEKSLNFIAQFLYEPCYVHPPPPIIKVSEWGALGKFMYIIYFQMLTVPMYMYM